VELYITEITDLSTIKRIVLDVLKPHNPSIIELAEKLGNIEGIAGVNISLEEVDAETDSVKITIEGSNIDYGRVKKEITGCGAVIHSIDGVSAGTRLVDEVNTPQDR